MAKFDNFVEDEGASVDSDDDEEVAYHGGGGGGEFYGSDARRPIYGGPNAGGGYGGALHVGIKLTHNP